MRRGTWRSSITTSVRARSTCPQACAARSARRPSRRTRSASSACSRAIQRWRSPRSSRGSVEAQEAAVGPRDILAAERTIVARRFGGSGGGYPGALQRARATRAVARDIVGDELRRRSIQARLTVPRPSGAELAELQQTYGSVQAREVQVEPAPSWLPDGRGVALALDAPPQVFTAPLDRAITIRTFEGVFVVRALADTAPLAAIPAAAARPAIGRALRTAAQADRYHSWTALKQKTALDQLRCVQDRLPQVGAVELDELPAVSDADGGWLQAPAGSAADRSPEAPRAAVSRRCRRRTCPCRRALRGRGPRRRAGRTRPRRRRHEARCRRRRGEDVLPDPPGGSRWRSADAGRAAPASWTSDSGRITANSSPPTRQATSAERTTSRTRSAASARTLSPARWPMRSFTALKSSRSMTTRARLRE